VYRSTEEIISFETDLNHITVAVYQQMLNSAPLKMNDILVIDMRHVRKIDTAGAAFFIWLHKQIQGKIVLANLSSQTKTLLNLLRLDNRIFGQIEDTDLIPTIIFNLKTEKKTGNPGSRLRSSSYRGMWERIFWGFIHDAPIKSQAASWRQKDISRCTEPPESPATG